MKEKKECRERRNPGKEEIEALRSKVYDALGRRDCEGARKVISAMAPACPGEAAELLVSSYVEEGDGKGAKEALKELFLLDPEGAGTRFLEARVAFMGGERVKTLELLQAMERKGVPSAWQEKVFNLMGQCRRFLGDSQGAAECYLKASEAAESPELAALEYSNYLFNLHYLPPLPAEKAREAAAGYDAFFRQVPRFYHRRREKNQEKIRVGYVSPDFRDHVVMRFSYALLTAYDRERFQVFAYMTGKGDGVSCYLAEQVDGWRDVSRCTPAEAARAIYEDRIDILVDLSGHTANTCLPILACKPAPVQVSGIGYFASTGLSAVDYFLGDPFLDDEGTGQEFTEELLLLPRSHFCYAPFHGNLPVGDAPCLRKSYVTFGSFNNFTKVNEDVLAAWAEIIRKVPGSRLLLKAAVFDYEDSRELSLGRIEAAGIDLARVEVRGITREYLPEYRDMDIALDTFPYPGGGTTCDALYMGVPVVTLRGGSHGGRFGWSILHNVGLGELCAASREEYVERAAALAGDRELLGALRQNLRQMMASSPLMDRRGYMQSVEQGYEMVWEKLLEQQKPVPLREAPRMAALMKRLSEAGEERQALAVADALLAASPPSRDIAENLAILYLDASEAGHALEAVSLLPGEYPLGKFLRARACYLQRDIDGAEKLCREVAGNGGLPYPWGGSERNLLAEICKDRGDVKTAAQEFLRACGEPRPPFTQMEDYSNYLLLLQYVPQSADFLFRESCKAGKYVKEAGRTSRHAVRSRKKLRIGYLSPDFRRHVVACFSQAFFAAADRSRFEVYAYAKCREDDVSRQMKEKAGIWRNVHGRTPREIAQSIRADEIDILVELAGHMGDNSLQVLALRPAPVQVCGIGYFSTTGLSCVDYFLVDEHTALPGEEQFFTEKLLRLPHSHFCYTQVLPVPEVARELPCERNGYLTFGSMNNVNKICDEALEAWGRILAALPDARLYLKNGLLDDPARRERELGRLVRVGIDASRVDLEGFSGDYLKDYRRMDIALDTFPYPGGGTTCDALYMGVPVISLAGGSNHERFGYSILSNLGLEELCGSTVDEYVDCAIGLARDRERLQRLHGELRGRMERSPVMDQNAYMRDLEIAYEEIWERYQKDGK